MPKDLSFFYLFPLRIEISLNLHIINYEGIRITNPLPFTQNVLEVEPKMNGKIPLIRQFFNA